MKILHTSAEFFPYIKVGGLSDMLASLSKFQAREDEVMIALPYIQGVQKRITFTGKTFPSIGADAYNSIASKILKDSIFREAVEGNLKLYFFDSPIFRHLPHIYHNPHEHFNFAVFSYACFYLSTLLNAEIVHAHDWHTAVVSVLHHFRSTGKPTCFTIHNLMYQGDHPEWMTGFLTTDPFFINQEVFHFNHKVNYMKASLQLSNELTTVSPGYRDEILHEPAGCGMSSILFNRKEHFTGLLNGIDLEEWNPEKDKKIYKNYSISSVDEGKSANKKSLYKEYGLDVEPERPLIGMIGRLTYQKGFDTFLKSFIQKPDLPFYYIILGTGDSHLENALFYHSHHNSQRMYFYKGFDEAMARKIEAAADFFLMPSMFEPCGLNQFYSHRYGAIPIVSRVGGLKNSVLESEIIENCTGLLFESGEDHSLNFALDRACTLYNDKNHFSIVRKNIMSLDWSWTNTVKKYNEIYQRAIQTKK